MIDGLVRSYIAHWRAVNESIVTGKL